MRTKFLAGVAIAALMVVAPFDATSPVTGSGVDWSTAKAQDANINISFFFDSLAPHGKWSRHGKYGYVFIPAVDRDWAPYTEGRWIWTAEHGWYWQSKEPFAWAVYHYGRWLYVADVGWVWVPGTKWGPAWVSWRKSNDYVGWAPLPPVRDGYVVDVDVDVVIDIDISYWHFVEAPRFLEPDLVVVIIDARERPEVYERTEYVGTVKVENNIVINNVIDIDYVEAETKQEVTVHKVETVDKPDAVAVEAESVQVFNPEIAPDTDKEPAETVELKEGTPPAPDGASGEATEPSQPADAGKEAPEQETETPNASDTPASRDKAPAQPDTPPTETPSGAKPQEAGPPAKQPADQPKAEKKEQPAEAQEQEQATPPAEKAEPKEKPAEVKPEPETKPEPKAEQKASPEQTEEQQPEQTPEAPTPRANPDQAPKEKPSEEAKEPKEEKAREKAPKECTPEMQAAGACQ